MLIDAGQLSQRDMLAVSATACQPDNDRLVIVQVRYNDTHIYTMGAHFCDNMWIEHESGKPILDGCMIWMESLFKEEK